MLANYTFNSHYSPINQPGNHLPSLQLLEGGKFYPQQFAPVLVNEYEQIRLKFFRWGFVPRWAETTAEGKNRIFAAADHVFTNVAYQTPVRSMRCLVPADGYYVETGNQTFKLSLPLDKTFCFAAIYDTWQNKDGSLLNTFAIITTPSSSQLGRFGLQMPMIVPRNLESIWMDPQTSPGIISRILHSPANFPFAIRKVQELRDIQEFERLEHVAA
ncbi:MAG: SOS response-associated peptidase family protein [Bacteroidia bacterium]|nr:SOS response-associated peptidase family protein [Bacteroidia bacterium]